MKISLESRRAMLASIKATCKAFRIEPDKVMTDATKNLIWFRAYCFTAYPDSNSNALLRGERVVDYNPDFPLYPDESHQVHIVTALNWIFKYLTAEVEEGLYHENFTRIQTRYAGEY